MGPIVVAAPTSIVTLEPPGLLRSYKVYQVLRYSSMFGVAEFVFFKDAYTGERPHAVASKLIEKMWKYYLTPPYLRKKLIPIDRDLKFVGMLPPLRLEVFDVSEKVYSGQLRMAYIYKREGKCLADIGAEAPYTVVGDCEEGVRLVRVRSEKEGIAELSKESVYTGPALQFRSSLRELLEERYGTSFVIATDRSGRIPVPSKGLQEKLSRGATILFGAPKYDLFQLARAEGISLMEYVDDVWNTIPGQKVVTVRTEEAILATLSIVNFLRHAPLTT